MADPAAPSAPAVLPFGSWPTPITSELVVRAAVGFGGVVLDGGDVWWSEQRPEEGGRTQLVLPPVGRHDARGPAARVERPHGRPRVRRWRVVGPVGDGVVRELGGPTPLPRRTRRRAGRRDARAGRAAGRSLGRRRGLARRPFDALRARAPSDRRRAGGRRERRGAVRPRRRGWSGFRLGAPVPARSPLGRRSSSTVRTSCPIPAGAPTARPSAGWSGTTRTCRGTAPVSWSRRRTAAQRCSSPAVPTSRSSSPAGTTTARSGSSPTAAAGGTSTAGRRTARSSRWS